MTLYAGESVLIKAEIKIDNILADPDTVKITVYAGTRTGTTVLAETDMIKTDTGLYEYAWDTTGQTAGLFFAKVHAETAAPGNWEFIPISLT